MTNPDPMPDDRTQPDYAAQTTAALQQWTSSLKRDKALAQLHDLAPHHPGARHVLDYLELSGVDTRSRFVPSLEHITVDKLQAIAALSTDPADIPTIHTRRAGAIWQLLGAVTIWWMMLIPLNLYTPIDTETLLILCPAVSILLLVVIMGLLPYLEQRVTIDPSGIHTNKVIGKNQHIAWAAIEQLEIKTLQYPAITEFTVHAGALRIPFVSLDAALYTVIHARPDIMRMAPNTVMALARYVLLVLGIGGGLLIASSSDTVQTLIGGVLLIPMLGMLIAHLWQRNTTAPRRLERVLGGIGLALVGIMVVIAAAYGILQEDGFQIGEILFLLVMGSGLLRLGYVLARNPGGVDQLVKQVDTTLEKYGPN